MNEPAPRADRGPRPCGCALVVLAVLCLGIVALLLDRGAEAAPGTVLVVLVDHLDPDHVGVLPATPDPTPRLTELAAEARVFRTAITRHLGTNGAVGSVLAGRGPDVLELGRHGLPQGSDTLALRFREAGYDTVGVASLRQLAASITGYDQGFDAWSCAGAPANGDPVPAGAAVDALVDLARSALEREAPLFAFLQLGALRTGEPADPAVALPWLERRLQPYLSTEPELRSALQDPVIAAAERVARVKALLGRRRGAPEWEALQRALQDAALVELDAALGRMLDLLEEHDRLDGALVAIAGSQPPPGDLVTDSPEDEILLAEVRVPLLLRLPGGADPGESNAFVSTAAVESTLRRWLEGAEAGQDGWDLRGLVDYRKALWPSAMREDWVDRPDGRSVYVAFGVIEGLVAHLTRPYRGVTRFGIVEGAPSGLDVRVRALAPSLRSQWGKRPEVTLALDPSEGGAEIQHELARNRPATLAFRGDETRVLVGKSPLPESPLLRLPDPYGEPWEPLDEGPPPWDVDLVRASGATRLVVTGANAPDGATVRVLIERYPPGEPARPLEVALETLGAVEAVPGRLDAVALEGPAPLRAVLRLRGDERPALSVAVDGDQVPVARMRYLGRRFTRGDLVLVLSEWFPEAMNDLYETREACESALPEHPDAWWWLRRDPAGPGRPLSPEDLAFVSRLRETE